MFNPLPEHRLILGVGRVLRSAAQDGPDDEYRRSQLLSAYSVARHLAAETAAAPELLGWLREALAAVLADAGGPAAAEARAAIAGAPSGVDVGAALTRLLAVPGADGLDDGTRGRVHAVLAEMADREVAALAEAPA